MGVRSSHTCRTPWMTGPGSSENLLCDWAGSGLSEPSVSGGKTKNCEQWESYFVGTVGCSPWGH